MCRSDKSVNSISTLDCLEELAKEKIGESRALSLGINACIRENESLNILMEECIDRFKDDRFDQDSLKNHIEECIRRSNTLQDNVRIMMNSMEVLLKREEALKNALETVYSTI